MKKESFEVIKQQIRAQILTEMDMSKDYSDDEIMNLIDEIIIRESCKTHLTYTEKTILSKELFHSIRKLDILEELMEDPKVTEIMINGKDHIFIERAGRLFEWEKKFESKEKLDDVIQQIVAKCNRTVNETQPIVDARYQGARINVVLNPIALNGPIVTIRRFPEKPIQMDDLIKFGAITKEVVEFLQKLVIANYNIFVSGGTGSGKTTFLNALTNFIPKDERIITIEDSAELQVIGVPNLVRLETRNSNVEGCAEINIRDLIRSSLRMRPDRIIVGEVRGGEALDMLQSLNTGHGGFSTGHANSARDMLSRIETMVLMGSADLPLEAIRSQVASGIDIIVHLGRLRDKSRKVLQIVEIIGFENKEVQTQVLYEFQETDDLNSANEDEIDNGSKVRLKKENKIENKGINKNKISGKFVKIANLTHTEKLQNAGIEI